MTTFLYKSGSNLLERLIDVRWNPQSTSIAQARDGHLVIAEPNQNHGFCRSTVRVEDGINVQSAAESIEFDLEIVDRSGIVKESVLALQSPVTVRR